MIIKEYRIVMPMTVAEYRVAQLYGVALAAKENTSEQEGIEMVKNASFEDYPLMDGKYCSGQYTYKIYHFESKIPKFIRYLLPAKAMSVHEEAWNAFPYCKTVLKNHSLGSLFSISIETIHLDDLGDTENALNLSSDILEKREIVYIDITSPVSEDYLMEEDPGLYKSEKTGRGPLRSDWKTTTQPLMTAYKLVKVELRLMGLQARIENWIHAAEQNLFLKFHRQMFCKTDNWFGMTMDDIRKMEEEIAQETEKKLKKRSSSAARMMTAENELLPLSDQSSSNKTEPGTTSF